MMYSYVIRLTPVDVTSLDSLYPLSDELLFNLRSLVFGYYHYMSYSLCGTEMMYVLTGNLRHEDLRASDSLFVKHVYIKQNLFVSYFHSPYNDTLIVRDIDFANHTLGDTRFDITVLDDFGLPLEFYSSNLNDSTTGKYTYITMIGAVVDTANGPEDVGYTYSTLFVPYVHDNIDDIYTQCGSNIDTLKVLSLDDCPKISLSLSEYQFQMDGLLFNGYNYTIPFNKFIYGNRSTIFVCVDTYHALRSSIGTEETHSELHNLDLTQVLSIVLVSVSLACILSTLLTYILLPSLQNLPGKNTISLSVHLFIAQSLYLLSSFSTFDKGTIACISSGIALHFFWLSTIMWTNVCTYHMLHVLTCTKHMVAQSFRRFFWYNLYPISVASMLVSVNVITSYIVTRGSSIGYGLTHCYIAFDDMLQYTFVIPTFVAVAANVAMFLYVIIALRRMPRVQSTRSQRNDLIIFVKLSSLTGVTWLLGFLYSWTGIVAFSYAFVLFCSTMGVFLFVSFVTNRRVLNLYKERFEASGSTKSTTLSKKQYVS